MDFQDTKIRIEAAYKLLHENTTTLEKFNSIRNLIKGVSPKVDSLLDATGKEFETIEKLKKGEIIDLTLENYPAETEEEKERKKKVLAFIRYWKELKSEVERIHTELHHEDEQNIKTNTESISKIVTFAKGPLGIITIVAAIIVLSYILLGKNNPPKTNSATTSEPDSKVQGIIVNGKGIPLSELTIGDGPECEGPHYHAKDHTNAKAIDGSLVKDPGGCGFGVVKKVEVVDLKV